MKYNEFTTNHYHQRRQCLWILYSIYSRLFNTNINKFAGFLNLFANTSLSNNGTSMIHILRNTKSLKLMSFLKSSITKNGITRIISPILNGDTARKSSLWNDVLNAILTIAAHALAVTLLSHISTKITALRDNSCAKSAPPHSYQKKIVSQNPIP